MGETAWVQMLVFLSYVWTYFKAAEAGVTTKQIEEAPN